MQYQLSRFQTFFILRGPGSILNDFLVLASPGTIFSGNTISTKIQSMLNQNIQLKLTDRETPDTTKNIPQVLQSEILLALSFYPELEKTTINFIFKQKIRGSVMQAQPGVLALLQGKRTYNINISSLFKLTHAAIPIHQVPSDILVGWIGHELGHIMDYENRSVWGMARFGLGYLLSARFVKEAERVADTYAVSHGLGMYIIETKNFILNHASLSEKYKRKISRLYLSPDEIVEQVKKLESSRILPS